MFAKKYICFDIGGTKILKAVIRTRGQKFDFFEVEEEKNPRKEEKIKNILLSYCRESRKKYKTKKVAISTADIVDSIQKTITTQKINFGTEKFDLKFVEDAGFSVRAENDGRCFALGEYHFGKGKEKQSILVLTLGTGIGGGFVLDGKNWRGAHSSALEVGRSKIFFEKKWLQWEWVAAGRGIEKNYLATIGEKITTKEVFEKAKKGDTAAKQALAQAQQVLGIGMANLLNILDPEMLIVGGSIAGQRKFMNDAFETARKNIINKKANYKFAISALGNRANLLGAASLFL